MTMAIAGTLAAGRCAGKRAAECATLHLMHTTRAYFFGYFWFSNAPGGREI
jgi:hypothetical protein